jgi:hypothetical protein
VEVRVRGGQVEPAKWRLVCDLNALTVALGEGEDIPYTDDGSGLLAFSDAERDTISDFLSNLQVTFSLEAVAQPDPTFLSRLQGRVTTRSAALEALASGNVPRTVEDIQDLESRVADLEAAQHIP